MPISSDGDDDKVTRLNVKFKEAVDPQRTLVSQWEVRVRRECEHLGAYIVDDRLDAVECSLCGERLSPMWVLKVLCGRDHKFAEARERYQDELRRLRERSRTKCRRCGEMTPISRG